MRRVYLITFLMLVSLCSLFATGGNFFLGHTIGSYTGENYYNLSFYVCNSFGDKGTELEEKYLETTEDEQYVGYIMKIAKNSNEGDVNYTWKVTFSKMYLIGENDSLDTTQSISYDVRILDDVSLNSIALQEDNNPNNIGYASNSERLVAFTDQTIVPLIHIYVTLDDLDEAPAGDYKATMIMEVSST